MAASGLPDRGRRSTDNAAGTVEGGLGAAEGSLGGFFGQARNALGSMSDAGYALVGDTALREAARKAEGHFHRCPECGTRG